MSKVDLHEWILFEKIVEIAKKFSFVNTGREYILECEEWFQTFCKFKSARKVELLYYINEQNEVSMWWITALWKHFYKSTSTLTCSE